MTDAAESPAAIVVSRLVVPLLLLLVSILLTVLLTQVSAVKEVQTEQAKTVAALETQFGQLNTKVDWALVQRINALEERVRTLERKVSP